MELPYLLKGIIIGVFVSAPLGPIAIFAIQRVLSKGLWIGFFSGLGAAVADGVFALIAAFSVSYVIDFMKENQLYLRIIGGGLLVFMGIKLFYYQTIKHRGKKSLSTGKLIRDFISVFALTLSNPITLFVFGALFAGILPATQNESNSEEFILAGGIFLGAILWWFGLSLIVSIFRSRITLRTLWWINKIAGVLIAILGAIILLGTLLFKDDIPTQGTIPPLEKVLEQEPRF